MTKPVLFYPFSISSIYILVICFFFARSITDIFPIPLLLKIQALILINDCAENRGDHSYSTLGVGEAFYYHIKSPSPALYFMLTS